MTEKPTLLVLSGLPGSGKSTIAAQWVAEDRENRRRINWDEMRLELYGPDWKFNRTDENRMQMASHDHVDDWLRAGLSVVIDNTNLTDKARGLWIQHGKELGAEVIEQEIDTPTAVCVERDRKREGRARVGRAVIERMALFHGFIDWSELPPKWAGGADNPDIVIVDIDGTLSDPSHRLHHIRGASIPTSTLDLETGKQTFHPRWDLFHAEVDKDAPKPIIIELVRRLSLHYWIIIVSGRSPEHGCGIKTEDWLDRHLEVPYVHLFMRQAGDYKPDFEHKQEILDLLPKERIAFVLDDRQQVVQMWRRNGLICLQVANGQF